MEPSIWLTIKHVLSLLLVPFVALVSFIGRIIFFRLRKLEDETDKATVELAVLRAQLSQNANNISDIKNSIKDLQKEVRSEMSLVRNDIKEILKHEK